MMHALTAKVYDRQLAGTQEGLVGIRFCRALDHGCHQAYKMSRQQLSMRVPPND